MEISPLITFGLSNLNLWNLKMMLFSYFIKNEKMIWYWPWVKLNILHLWIFPLLILDIDLFLFLLFLFYMLWSHPYTSYKGKHTTYCISQPIWVSCVPPLTREEKKHVLINLQALQVVSQTKRNSSARERRWRCCAKACELDSQINSSPRMQNVGLDANANNVDPNDYNGYMRLLRLNINYLHNFKSINPSF